MFVATLMALLVEIQRSMRDVFSLSLFLQSLGKKRMAMAAPAVDWDVNQLAFPLTVKLREV